MDFLLLIWRFQLGQKTGFTTAFRGDAQAVNGARHRDIEYASFLFYVFGGPYHAAMRKGLFGSVK